jgi:hypothetical protein
MFDPHFTVGAVRATRQMLRLCHICTSLREIRWMMGARGASEAGESVTHKRALRLYTEAALRVRGRRRKKIPSPIAHRGPGCRNPPNVVSSGSRTRALRPQSARPTRHSAPGPQHRIQICWCNAGWQQVGANRRHGHPTVQDVCRPLDQQIVASQCIQSSRSRRAVLLTAPSNLRIIRYRCATLAV